MALRKLSNKKASQETPLLPEGTWRPNISATPFIFSGSSRHMLQSMFSASGRPFYQRAELMYPDKIAEADYREFCENFSLIYSYL